VALTDKAVRVAMAELFCIQSYNKIKVCAGQWAPDVPYRNQ